ncbi:hypothetical protein [Amycolatopsis sp. EV170708-02-1]|uniref:hypothetical protein n=1 Tax=Amycolatopsis sp. EV170708-02-1 TaxID=2919322 RepID=UPI001F0B8179|nr:hypothetical protein [Amycolatopsis sp. EV170708-02-1]UMP07219.1 hypothetical protein MJQ72_21475 [Amycolatopsis sp. EV170708-02-1]
MTTQSPKYQEDLDYFANYARHDWAPPHNVFVSAGNILGTGAGLPEIIQTAEAILDDLFARNVRVGGLTDHCLRLPDLAWHTHEWLKRIRQEIVKRGAIPDLGQLGWLHIPE